MIFNFKNKIFLFSLHFRMNVAVVVLLSLIYAPHSVELTANIPTATETILKKLQCQGDRAYNLIGYDCSQMDLREVPQNIRSSVEVNQIGYFRFTFNFLFVLIFRNYTILIFMAGSDQHRSEKPHSVMKL